MVSTTAAPSVDVFRAVADPTRRAILDRLRASELSVNDLAGPFDMSQPAISQHLRILLDAGLVEAEQVGRQRLYKLNAQPLREVFQWSSLYRNLLTDPVGHAWHIRGRTPQSKKRTRRP
jgi:DNA-binding transcriptional ArsR family regulator